MSRRCRTPRLPIAALLITLSPLVMAWTSYGYGPYEPGYQGGYPGTAPSEPPPAAATEPSPPPVGGPTSAYDSPPGYSYGIAPLQTPYGESSPGTTTPEQTYRGYGPPSSPPGSFPGFGGRGFAPPSGFRLSRTTSDDAYTLTVELNGMAPEEVQVRTQGQWLMISRERNEQRVQKDSFDDGRGYIRSFSYSTGTSSRRLLVPPDGDLSAMDRKDGEGSIHIRIPRHGN